MNIYFDRSFETMDTEETVSSRLYKWSQEEGFICTRASLGYWEYRRGTHFQALYTFRIRKIPTTVTVRMKDEQPANVHCSMAVKSWLSIETGRDKKRFNEQMKLLVAYIEGSL
jgi:hypothetical protein